MPRTWTNGGVALALAVAAGAQVAPEAAALWRDAEFQKQFVAGYGVNADVEPRVTPAEVKLLERIRPLMADQLALAEAALQEAIKPESSAMLDFTLGALQFQQDKAAAALANFQAAVTKFPSFRRAWRNLGFIHVRAGRFAEAIAAFTRMIELGGSDGYAFGLLGFAYAQLLDYQPAEAAYRNALLLQPENIEWRLGLTRCVYKQQKFEDAANLLDALLQRHPDKSEFWLLQAHTYLGMKQPLKAAADLEVIDRLGRSTTETLHLLGDIYVNENLMELAAQAYCRAMDVDGRQPVARPLRSAEVLVARGALAPCRLVTAHLHQVFDAAMAEADRRRLLKLEARLAMAEGGGGAETAKLLEEVVALDPLDGDALLLLGQQCFRQKEPDRALFWYERAASIEAFEVDAKVRQAQVLVSMERYNDAIPLLRRAQTLRPREELQRYLEQVERIARARR